MKSLALIMSILVIGISAYGENRGHDQSGHDEGKGAHSPGAHASGGKEGRGPEEEKRPQGEEHHEEEGGGNVGPDKGILLAEENLGIQLAAEAYKNFEIKTMKLKGTGPWALPSSSRLLTLEEANLYRVRDGYIKRISFHLARSTEKEIVISSEDLKIGDELVTQGVGFLRIAELAAFGGASEGHSH